MAVKTKAGRYAVEFELRGKRIHRRLPKGATRAQAEALEARLRNEIFEARDLGVKPEVSLPAAIQTWLDEVVSQSRAKASINSHARQLAPVVIGKTIAQIPEAAEAYRKLALANGFAKATINQRLLVLKAVATWACEVKEWTDTNLSPKVKIKRPNNERHNYLDQKQVNKLISCMETDEGKAWVALLSATGLRRMELWTCGKVGGGHVRGGKIHLPPQITKTEKPRAVPVAAWGIPYLSALPFQRGPKSLWEEFNRACKAAGLVDFHQHDLRHTFASLLINTPKGGVDIYVVGKLLGHTSPVTTQRYAHLSTKTLEDAVAKLAA